VIIKAPLLIVTLLSVVNAMVFFGQDSWVLAVLNAVASAVLAIAFIMVVRIG